MEFETARDFLLTARDDYDVAYRDFRWPGPETFNWALDWFDVIAAGNDRPALWIIDDDTETTLVLRGAGSRSDALAGWLREQRGPARRRTLLMLGNRAELWECILALTKLGAVIIPSSTLLTPADIGDRVERGNVAHVDRRVGADRALRRTSPAHCTRIAVGDRRRRDGSTTTTSSTAASTSRRTDQRGRRSALSVLHLGDNGAAEAGRAHARELPGRSPLDDVLDRPAARRRASQHLARPAGRSTRGATSSRRGTPRRPSSSSTAARFSRDAPARHARRAARSPRSARRPRCGGCSSRRT